MKRALPSSTSSLAGAHGVGDGRVGIRPVVQKHVDMVHTEVLKAALAAPAHRRRAPVPPVGVHGLVPVDAELGDHDHLVAPPAQRGAHQRLGMPHAVAGGGVEQVDALIDRRVNGRRGLGVHVRAVEAPAHGPAAKPDHAHAKLGRSHLAVPHAHTLSRTRFVRSMRPAPTRVNRG